MLALAFERKILTHNNDAKLDPQSTIYAIFIYNLII